jgi:hypothetical protein
MSVLMSESEGAARTEAQAGPVRFYARIGMAELLARVYYLKEIPRGQFFPIDNLDMPTDPERFLGWLETDFCASLLSGKIAMSAYDSRNSYRFGCALVKGIGAVVAVDAPLTADADELRRGVRIVFARRSTAREIREIFEKMQAEDDICEAFKRYRIYPVGRYGKLWARRCGTSVERRPRDAVKIVKMLAVVYPYFDVAADAADAVGEEK